VGLPLAFASPAAYVLPRKSEGKTTMSMTRNLLLSVLVALAVGGGKMAYDTWRGAEWEISPRQIADAKAQGKAGYESSPGTVAVLPIRSETADLLPVMWVLYGLAAGAVTFIGLRKRKAA
jgi:hypothetical protein